MPDTQRAPKEVWVHVAPDGTLSLGRTSQHRYVHEDQLPRWRDIASAPKDGTWLLLRRADRHAVDQPALVGQWRDGGWRDFAPGVLLYIDRWAPLPPESKEQPRISPPLSGERE